MPANPQAAVRTVVFAGGGTGGHLYPAVAIAEQLQALRGDSDVQSVFVCSDRPLDARILSNEGQRHIAIAARPFSLAPVRFAAFAAGWPGVMRCAKSILRDCGDPEHVFVLAMGGFVSAPMVKAALAERVSVGLVNLDAVPGKANTWISRRIASSERGGSECVMTTAPLNGKRFKSWIRIPPIVRQSARATGDKRSCREQLGLDPDAPTLMVSGGSQGARSINDLLLALADAGSMSKWQVLHQTGRDEAERMAAAYDRRGVQARVVDFCNEMGLWWGAADAAIGRAGAGTVAEAWANHVPTVFLPYPYHKDEHQRANVQPLLDAGGAVVCRDLIEGKLNYEAIGPAVRVLMNDEGARARMTAALHHLGPANGAEKVARMILER